MNKSSVKGGLEQGEESQIGENQISERKRLRDDLIDAHLNDHDAINKEKIERLKQKRVYGKPIAIIAATVPLVLLLVMGTLILCYPAKLNSMGDWGQAIFISGSFLSFIIIYAGLVKSMFSSSKDDDIQTIKEGLDIIQKYSSHSE